MRLNLLRLILGGMVVGATTVQRLTAALSALNDPVYEGPIDVRYADD